MPRRPPPSPLHLHTGPTPSRSQPKHTLPSPPRPAFYAAKSTPYPPSVTRAANFESPTMPVVAAATVTATTTTTAATAWLTWSWFPSSEPSATSNRAPSPKTAESAGILGPWVQTRRFSERMLAADGLIKVPEPVAVIASPVSYG